MPAPSTYAPIGNTWTDAKRATLRTMMAAGESDDAIAEAVGHGRNGVAKERHRLGLLREHANPSLTDWSNEAVATLRQMRAQKVSYPKIGLALGKSASEVRTKCRRLAMVPPRAQRPCAGQEPAPVVERDPKTTLPVLASMAAFETALLVQPAVPPRSAVRGPQTAALVCVQPAGGRPAPVRERQCAWPVSSGRPWRYCEAVAEGHGVYCAHHHAVSRASVQPSRQPGAVG